MKSAPLSMAWPADPDELQAELRRVQDEIDALYWRFTRCANAPPPVLANPELYKLRSALWRKVGDWRAREM